MGTAELNAGGNPAMGGVEISSGLMSRLARMQTIANRYIIKQLDYSLSISMLDCSPGLRPRQLSRDRNLALPIETRASESLG